MNLAYLAPFFIQKVPDLLLAVFIKELLQIVLGLLRRSSRGAFEKAMRAVLTACSPYITFPTKIVAAIIAL